MKLSGAMLRAMWGFPDRVDGPGVGYRSESQKPAQADDPRFLKTLTDWEKDIQKSYRGRNRSKLWLVSCLMQEAGELAELVIKKDGYNKPYTRVELLSEAGDVINFLTAVLQDHDLTVEDAIKHNSAKLRERGWIK